LPLTAAEIEQRSFMMSQVRNDVIERLQMEEQRLLELRDMSQDREELELIALELASLQLVLSDVSQMDDERLSAVLERCRTAKRASLHKVTRTTEPVSG
jgi:hypothetical protein